MKFVGVVQYVTDTHIRLLTIYKKQEIDVFFTESKAEAMNLVYQKHVTCSIDVELQSIEIGHVMLAKLWLKSVLFPPLPIDHGDFSPAQEARFEKIKILYKKKV